jgi:ABC-type transporter Mla maintaining outer membrane lipid asymmetry permease subunit MlaE
MSGNKLFARFEKVHGVSKDLEHHKSLAHLLIWLVIPMAVLAVAAYVVQRKDGASKAVVGVVAALAVASAGAVLVDIALIGHAGASSAWKPIVDNTNR